MSMKNTIKQDAGNTTLIAAVVIAVLAIGGLAFMTLNKGGNNEDITDVAAAQPASGPDDLTAPAAPEIKPGNPVVAKVGDQEIMRSDVLGFIQQLPPNARQQPLPQLFATAQEQVINGRVLEEQTAKVNLENDEEFKEQLARAKEEITRNLFVGREVQKRVSEDRMKEVYDAYIAAMPKVEERKARHILVDDEAKAKEILAKVKAGEDFAKLAEENSSDATAEKGGELGYFAKGDVVPEFGEAVFSTEPGEIVPEVVKSQFGYHVVAVDDKRTRPSPTYEALKPQLEAQVRREALDKLIDEWKESETIVRFDINGEPIEPAAGE